MSRSTLRTVLTIVLYIGVAISLLPYLLGDLSTGVLFLIAGIVLAVVCGLLRCYLTEGDCTDPSILLAAQRRESNSIASTSPHQPPHSPHV